MGKCTEGGHHNIFIIQWRNGESVPPPNFKKGKKRRHHFLLWRDWSCFGTLGTGVPTSRFNILNNTILYEGYMRPSDSPSLTFKFFSFHNTLSTEGPRYVLGPTALRSLRGHNYAIATIMRGRYMRWITCLFLRKLNCFINLMRIIWQ